MDVETDALIQSTVREEFANCTMVAIGVPLNMTSFGDRIQPQITRLSTNKDASNLAGRLQQMIR